MPRLLQNTTFRFHFQTISHLKLKKANCCQNHGSLSACSLYIVIPPPWFLPTPVITLVRQWWPRAGPRLTCVHSTIHTSAFLSILYTRLLFITNLPESTPFFFFKSLVHAEWTSMNIKLVVNNMLHWILILAHCKWWWGLFPRYAKVKGVNWGLNEGGGGLLEVKNCLKIQV